MSKRSKIRRSSGPRRKRLRRPARLEAPRRWIASGARVTPKTYAGWFGTDRYTAYQELQMLGVPLRPQDACWAVRPPPVPRQPRPDPDPLPSDGSGWVEVGGTLMFPVGYTEGGCPYGPTLDDLEPEEREAVLADLGWEVSAAFDNASRRPSSLTLSSPRSSHEGEGPLDVGDFLRGVGVATNPPSARMAPMRYETAVRRLRTIAESCERPNRLTDTPILVAAYVFGDLLDGRTELPRVQVAFVIDCPPEEVTWFAEPSVGVGIVSLLDLEKAPVEWYWRPLLWPVWNHAIRGPVRFWSVAGPDEEVLEALGQRRFADLHRLVPTAGEELAQLEVELEASLTHLRRVVEGYWDREWRADHKGLGWYPEDHLWRAAHGYLDLMSGLADRLRPKGE